MKFKDIENIIGFQKIFCVKLLNPYTDKPRAYVISNTKDEKIYNRIREAEVVIIKDVPAGYKRTAPAIFLDIQEKEFNKPAFKNIGTVSFKDDEGEK
jgi:hypothetical protein